jgi:Uncharacterized conserved protein (COG2071)
MLHLLKRHTLSVTAFFRQSLVLTYAFPSHLLQPLLPPGLILDAYRGFGFLAIAMVQTERMRPSFLPAALGRDFFLAGYRIFTRLGNSASSLRGLRILRSDTNHRWMVRAGNLLTHYHYRLCHAELRETPGEIEWSIRTPRQEADLRIVARISNAPAALPPGSPFLNIQDARRFSGPLPYTFDYEKETHSIIRIHGVRREWKPQPVDVQVLQNTFLLSEPFCQTAPILANAFYLRDVPYRWERGVRTSLEIK